jgi:uncharacterized protein involved in exopolysaccharide biosynthesis
MQDQETKNQGAQAASREFAAELIDFIRIARFLRRHWFSIGSSAVFGVVLGFGVSYAFPKLYRAEVVVSPTSSASGSTLSKIAGSYGVLASLSGIDIQSGDPSTAENLALLRSRRFMKQFISERQLLPIFFPEEWDDKSKGWRSNESEPSLLDGYDLFRKIMFIEEDKNSTLITLKVEWRDGDLAAQWANFLIADINRLARDIAILESDRNIRFLNEQLKTMERIDIQKTIYSLLEAQMNKRMLASTMPDYAFKVIDPAVASSDNRYVKPNRIGFAAVGLCCGVLVGVAIAIFGRARNSGTS